MTETTMTRHNSSSLNHNPPNTHTHTQPRLSPSVTPLAPICGQAALAQVLGLSPSLSLCHHPLLQHQQTNPPHP